MALVNLYSDTQTRPTPAMRKAMAEAEVGDEQSFADPTVIALCERVAELLGFEAAVFLPTGTMCNAIGFRLHIRAGRRRGAAAPHRPPAALRGRRPGGDVGRRAAPARRPGRDVRRRRRCEAALSTPGDRYAPRSRLVSVEQTTNIAGGRVWPLEQVRAVVDVAQAARACGCTWTARG